MIDKKNAMEAFRTYTANYDPGVPMIMHKIRHSARVCANAERIAASIKPALSEEDVRFAWLLGLVHDIGRFEQVRRYNTFIDAVSVDHAELSADILFRDGLIRSFTDGALSEEDERTAETAVRTHNKLTIPDGLDERTLQFCQILRDADKTDIFRLVAEMPFETRVGASRSLFTDAEEACPEVMECVYEHRCIPRDIRMSVFDGHISHCCLAFELVYPDTRRMVSEQGWLHILLSPVDQEGNRLWSDRATEQLRIVREEIEKCWGHPVHIADP